MGERAQVYFTDGKKVGPGVYLHWNGPDVAELLLECKNHMQGCEGDLDYTTARFIGICHDAIPGNLSLGVSNAPADGWWNHSPGDAGAFLVHVGSWTVECADGYGFGDESGKTMPPVRVLSWAEVMRVAARAVRDRARDGVMNTNEAALAERFKQERLAELGRIAKAKLDAEKKQTA